MLCFDDAPIVAAFFSLLGAVLLVWPAWRASRILKSAFELSNKATEEGSDQKQSAFDEGIKATAKAIEDDAGKWTPRQHRQLIGGIGLMVAGGLIGLIDACCKAGSLC
jgi:hypothetical protein